MQKKTKRFTKSLIMKLNLSNGELFAFILILLTSIFLRFVNYENRWGLAYDQARDAIVSHQILVNMQLPLSGPFSASGPFVFGPFWYWFHALVTFFNPNSVMWLWIVQTSISAVMPIIMFFVGRMILNNKFGLLIAFFTAISTAQIAQSTNLTYSSFVGFVSVLIVFFFVLFVKTKNSTYLLTTALLMGLAMNIHFQAVGYMLFLPILFLINIRSIKNISLILLGFFIPFIPLVIFDFMTNHYQSSNILDYLFAGGGQPGALQKRLLTYVGVFWANAYSHIIGGYWPIGLISGVLTFVVVVFTIWKKKLDKIILIFLLFFAFNFVVLRYFKGNIYDAFLVFLHPYILIITAWAVYKIVKYNKYLGLVLLLIIVTFTLIKNYEEISNATNFSSTRSENYMNQLQENFPGEKFAVFDYEFKSSSRSNALVMYLLKNDLISDNGRKVGILQATVSAQVERHNAPIVRGELRQDIFLDLSAFDIKELEDKNWVFVNPSAVYESVIHWYEKEKE